ncbi:MAG TPA: tail fiber domain-containing protein, partial [Stellaceae bacterium]|nr:tail fiber domain-containing protein [Stellaceae bacterium]
GTGTAGICLGTSSARFKKAIRNEYGSLRSDLDLTTSIMRLRPVDFVYKPGRGYDPSKHYNGFLAEDVVKVWPDLVGLDAQGKPNTVDLLGMLPRAIAQIQIQQYETYALYCWNILLTVGVVVLWRRKR